jgi:peptide deformylase
MVHKVLIWPANRLYDKSAPVSFDYVQTDEFKTLIVDMKETLAHYHGVGLSAIQIGVPLRVFVMRTNTGVEAFINPSIMEYLAPFQEMEEGCLSVPGVFEMASRSPEVIVAAMDPETGTERLWELADVEAQCAQHEIEHFEGKTMMDRVGTAKRQVLRRKMQKAILSDAAYLTV